MTGLCYVLKMYLMFYAEYKFVLLSIWVLKFIKDFFSMGFVRFNTTFDLKTDKRCIRTTLSKAGRPNPLIASLLSPETVGL